MAVIEIENLCKSYGDNRVYDGFSITFGDGICCVLGESGSGKTTLLNCIAGLTKYDGRITPLTCSYVFREPRLVPNLTVLNNLLLVCPDAKKATDMIDALKLSDKAKAYPATLSAGQAQRVSLARAFLYESDALLLDEPFSSLDLKLKIEMYDLALSLIKSSGRAAVWVTHDADEALCVADRVVVIKGGEAVADFDIPERLPREYGGDTERRKKIIAALTATN